MSSRSRSPNRMNSYQLVPTSRTQCLCTPCPWCTLRLPHEIGIADVKESLRAQIDDWANNGCSAFQVALVTFSYEWILRHHEQRPYGPVQQPNEIAAIRGKAVQDCANQTSYLASSLVVWTQAPPPPPYGPQSGGSSSSGTAARVTGPVPAWFATNIQSPDTELPTDDAWWDTTQEPLVVHPHFQWNAGTSAKKWRSFEEPWQTRMREAYTDGQTSFRIIWEDDHPNTNIDFVNMHQTNEETTFQRKIRIKPQ
jgi:hypothetical protein